MITSSGLTFEPTELAEEPKGYLDFAIEVQAAQDDAYTIAVRSPTGEVQATVSFPLTAAALESHLLKLENAICVRRGGVCWPNSIQVRWMRGEW